MIAANASSLPEIITDGVHGKLVPPGDPPSLGAAIIDLAGDAAARASLAKAGRARVIDEFSATAMVDLFEEALKGAVEARQPKEIAGKPIRFR